MGQINTYQLFVGVLNLTQYKTLNIMGVQRMNVRRKHEYGKLKTFLFKVNA